LRAALVKRDTLAGVARELDLGASLTLGEGERKSGGHRRNSILADALEAVIGAAFLDSDFATVHGVIARLFQSRLRELPSADELKDAKTRLQEYLQRRRQMPPEYEVVDVGGADHARWFTVRCRIVSLDVERSASAGNRRKAEQRAAQACLDTLVPD